jgi:integrase
MQHVNVTHGAQSEHATRPLPHTAATQAGHIFRPEDTLWRIPSVGCDVVFDFTSISRLVDVIVERSLKRTLIDMLRRGSVLSAQNALRFFGRWVAHEPVIGREALTASHFVNWRHELVKRRPDDNRPGYLASFLRRWDKLRLPGLSPDLKALLCEIVLSGNIKGKAVATRDPVRGPFSDSELRALQQRLHAAYEDGIVTLQVYAAAWLYMGLGLRPSQLVRLKLKDYVPGDSLVARPALLAVPRTKQRGQQNRDAFKYRKLSDDLDAVIAAQMTDIKTRGTALGLTKPDFEDLPLFAAFDQGRDVGAAGYAYHISETHLRRALMRQLNALKVVSERTGQLLKISPYRFRYTMATRASQMGAGELVIAELLDHSDTQHVGVYVKSSPQALQRIDAALALSLAPIAQAFAGTLVRAEKAAVRGSDPDARIYNPEAVTEPLGTCGSYGWCGLWAGVACYTCRQFQPWQDGPHEPVLAWLIKERDGRRERGAEPHIVQLHDQTILAVAEVVRLCAGTDEKTKGRPHVG